MRITKNIIVKQILTEESKHKLLQKYTRQKAQLKKECEQLKFQQKKLEKQKNANDRLIQKKMDREIERRLEKELAIDFQIEQLHLLPLGSEISISEVQAQIEVKVGDDWGKIMRESSIIIKDGIVHEIRTHD